MMSWWLGITLGLLAMVMGAIGLYALLLYSMTKWWRG
jgi:hypothetical protein